jgi:asparagine synthase (glutamine-hydrolysing)
VCGLAGALAKDPREAERAVEAMCRRMVPRGPDDEGVNVIPAGDGWIALGSTRLAIIDLSPAGHQPMHDPERGTTIVYNGMIYNYRELRRELEASGVTFTSDCDTEVVLKAYDLHGPRCVEKLRGMFAFAIWDSRNRELFLARDRLGIKPLYYCHRGREFLFASQVKALLASGLVDRRFSPEGVATFLGLGAVSDPLTIVEDVRALPAGHTATFADGGLRLNRYWELQPTPQVDCSRDDAVARLRATLDETVGGHLVSDAPLGVFLSGGLDSSVLTALAARHTDHLKAISVVFGERAYSEETYIDAVTRKLGVDHVRVCLDAASLRNQLTDAFAAMDQPSFDGINTYFVSKAAHEAGLKVALSGLGADELFDGYGYARRTATLERVRRLPDPVLRLASAGALTRRLGARGQKMGNWLAGELTPGSSYELLRRLFLPAEVRQLMPASVTFDGLPRPASLDPSGDVAHQLSVLDLTNYTKNVLLRDTDAMSMANSLEVRVPYLDDRFVESMLRVPSAFRARKNKALLAASARDLLPQEVLDRKKHGFLLPLRTWMLGDLRSEVASTLTNPPASVHALLDQRETRRVWTRFSSDEKNWLRPWALYALCKWVEGLVHGPLSNHS